MEELSEYARDVFLTMGLGFKLALENVVGEEGDLSPQSLEALERLEKLVSERNEPGFQDLTEHQGPKNGLHKRARSKSLACGQRKSPRGKYKAVALHGDADFDFDDHEEDLKASGALSDSASTPHKSAAKVSLEPFAVSGRVRSYSLNLTRSTRSALAMLFDEPETETAESTSSTPSSVAALATSPSSTFLKKKTLRKKKSSSISSTKTEAQNPKPVTAILSSAVVEAPISVEHAAMRAQGKQALLEALCEGAFEADHFGAASLQEAADRFEAEIFATVRGLQNLTVAYTSSIAQSHEFLKDSSVRDCLTEDATRACLLEDFHVGFMSGIAEDQCFLTRCAGVTP